MQQKEISRREFLIRAAKIGGLVAALVGVGCGETPQSTSKPAAKALEEPTKEPTKKPTKAPEPTKEPTKTPEPTKEPTKAPEPTKEPTKTPEPTKEPTKAPEPTKEPTKTPEPTSEATPTPEVAWIPEELFPKWGVFSGDIKTKDGKDTGRIMITRLPQPGGDTYMSYMKFCLERSGGGEGYWGQGFEFTLEQRETGTYVQRQKKIITLELKPAKGTITGKVTGSGWVGETVDINYDISLTKFGEGRQAVIDAVRRAMRLPLEKRGTATYSDDQVIQELKRCEIYLP